MALEGHVEIAELVCNGFGLADHFRLGGAVNLLEDPQYAVSGGEENIVKKQQWSPLLLKWFDLDKVMRGPGAVVVEGEIVIEQLRRLYHGLPESFLPAARHQTGEIHYLTFRS